MQRIRLTELTFLTLLPVSVFAQDTRYPPKNQLIPGPECLTLQPAWQGGSEPCSSVTHEAWLNDVRH